MVEPGCGVARASGRFLHLRFLGPPPKDHMASIEHPLFTLATRPDRRILRYSHGEAGSRSRRRSRGCPTIHDKDVLTFCVSQLMAAVNAGRPTSAVLRLKAHDPARHQPQTSGDELPSLREALERLSGTRVVTNLATGGESNHPRLRPDRRTGDVRRARMERMIPSSPSSCRTGSIARSCRRNP